MRRRRAPLSPSTGHRLVRLITNGHGRRVNNYKSELAAVGMLGAIQSLVGPDREVWAVRQLLELPERVYGGWRGMPRRRKGGR